MARIHPLTLAKLGCGAALGLAVALVACSVSLDTDPGGTTLTVGILGKVVTITFKDVGAIEAKTDETVTVPTAIRLFEENPPATPPRAQLILPTANVSVAQRLAKRTARALPISGSATLRFYIAPGQSADLCASATLLAEYGLVLTAGSAALTNESFELSQAAIAAVMANDVTICIEVTSDFDGDITIGEVSFGFAGGAAGNTPPGIDLVPNVLPGGATQVPIDNANGKAVRAPINRVIGGVSYGIVGVLEAATPAVTVPAVDSSSVTVVPAELGLLSVDTLYIATHSSFVPDVGNGVKLATLTVTYADSQSATVLDLVTGSNTAEWSYDRPEHATMYGGVRHAKAPTLYSFESDVDSTTTYTGYVYSVSLRVDQDHTISSISLTMTDPATYAGSRAVTGDLTAWAGQAMTGITLAGTALIQAPESQTFACCLPDGRCVEVSDHDCLIILGGEIPDSATSCAAVSCPAGTPPATQACCLDNSGCLDLTPTECTSLTDFIAEPAGEGTSCATYQCTQACCFDFGIVCEDYPEWKCDSLIGDAQGEGTECATAACPELQACCLPDGTCQDADPVACGVAGGASPGTQGLKCSDLAINNMACAQPDGACCSADGCCAIEAKDQCEADGGTFQGADTTCDSDPCPDAWTCVSIINFPDPANYAAVEPACDLDSGKLLSAYPGGGSDPTEPAAFKDDLLPGKSWPTREEAAAACCELFENYTDDPAFIPTGTRNGTEYGLDRVILDECPRLGACCYDSGCTDASREDCAALSATFGTTDFKGPGTSCDAGACAPPVEYVIWYTSNVCCWGAPWIEITTRDTFEEPRLRSSFPGGGIDPEELATKVEIMGGFDTADAARAWICPQLISRFNHFWCGSGYIQWNGGNWKLGFGCDEVADLPFVTVDQLPEFDGCAAASP